MTNPPDSTIFIEALRRARFDPKLDLWRTEVPQSPHEPLTISVDAPHSSVGLPRDLIVVCAGILQKTVSSLQVLRSRVADDLLDTYNDNWADDDPDEGPPEMDREDFMAALTLADISLHGIDGGRTIMFSCGDLFAGHVVVLTLDNTDQPVGRATLFG